MRSSSSWRFTYRPSNFLVSDRVDCDGRRPSRSTRRPSPLPGGHPEGLVWQSLVGGYRSAKNRIPDTPDPLTRSIISSSESLGSAPGTLRCPLVRNEVIRKLVGAVRTAELSKSGRLSLVVAFDRVPAVGTQPTPAFPTRGCQRREHQPDSFRSCSPAV
jgi:hypothetical protein